MRCWRPLSLLCCLASFSSFPTNAIAKPFPESILKDPSIDSDLTRSSPTLPRALTPRSYGFQSFFNLGAGWNLYYSSWSSTILPAQPAAWALSQLYNSMATNGATIWRLSPPLHTIPLRVGNVALLMECTEEPIPWDLVMMFGRRLLSITEGGWTGLYRLMLSNAENDVTIDIILRIVERV